MAFCLSVRPPQIGTLSSQYGRYFMSLKFAVNTAISGREQRYIFSLFRPCFLLVSSLFSSGYLRRKTGVNKREVWHDIRDAQRTKKSRHIWTSGGGDRGGAIVVYPKLFKQLASIALSGESVKAGKEPARYCHRLNDIIIKIFVTSSLHFMNYLILRRL
jgi:hypothetical protein